MKIVAIVQARMGSSRLPGKVLKPLVNQSVIALLLARLSKSQKINSIYVATSVNKENDLLCNEIEMLGYNHFRGSEDDVLDRFYHACVISEADTVVRITGDCPLVDANVVDAVIDLFLQNDIDYASNIYPPSFPDGLDVEVFSRRSLKCAHTEAKEPFEREHVTPYIRNGDFTSLNLVCSEDLSDFRFTLDEIEDFHVLNNVFERFSPDIHFSYTAAVNHLRKNPKVMKINSAIKRNEGVAMGQGQKLWKRAKKVIPGGNMLLSKRSEMHLPDHWPSYFSKTKGCKVWDLDGNQLIDTYYMGVGTNILGYSHPEIDAAVMDVVASGNMSTLNAPEEVWLAEKLIEITPWAGGVRFARSGGEANTIAVRIARAASGKDGIAVCGYHGWHDWYLSANLGTDDSLAGHLLPGLSTVGVPSTLRNVVFPFEYNDLCGLKSLISTQAIGVVKMEVMRSVEPQNNFLKKVRKICDDNGIILVFDECTSGFRETFGGLHKKYDVEPDLVVFGKTLGNGYAVSAVVGKPEVMELAQTTFISSTFWTERIGSAAGLKTLSVMEQIQPWEYVTTVGNKVRNIWLRLAKNYDTNITLGGLPAISTFSFNSKNALKYKTLVTQEMLRKGFLAGTAFYVCTEHTQEVLDLYETNLDPIFQLIGECENGRDIDKLLSGPVCHSGFKRLN